MCKKLREIRHLFTQSKVTNELSKHNQRACVLRAHPSARQVERMHQAIQHWKMKIAQNRQECEERNQQLRGEKEQIQKHFQELKAAPQAGTAATPALAKLQS